MNTLAQLIDRRREAAAIVAGRALDMQGRRTVDLAPRTVGTISICGVGDADKTQRISRGRSI